MGRMMAESLRTLLTIPHLVLKAPKIMKTTQLYAEVLTPGGTEGKI